MTLKDRVWRFKARVMTRALRMTHGNVARAAELLGMDRTAFYVTAKRCGIWGTNPTGPRPAKPQVSAAVAKARREWLRG